MIGRCRACGAPAAAADERELAPRDELCFRRRPPRAADYGDWLFTLPLERVIGADPQEDAR